MQDNFTDKISKVVADELKSGTSLRDVISKLEVLVFVLTQEIVKKFSDKGG